MFCHQFYILQYLSEKYLWGIEDDIKLLHKSGIPGDFLIYPKMDDKDGYPVRIAFMLVNKMEKRVVQKIKVLKKGKWVSFDTRFLKSSEPEWYDTVAEMIDNVPDEFSWCLQRPFLEFHQRFNENT